jgi:uncharacterized protein YkwD
MGLRRGELEKICKAMACVNDVRAEHGMPALAWDDTLQDLAEG